MSSSPRQIAKTDSQIPVFAIVVLALIFVFGLFFVGHDQGENN